MYLCKQTAEKYRTNKQYSTNFTPYYVYEKDNNKFCCLDFSKENNFFLAFLGLLLSNFCQ